jgi:hypothetical protein
MQDSQQSSLGRQLEICLARQMHLDNLRRHGPLQALVGDKAIAGMQPPARLPWPHPSQHSLDSQVSRTQLAQAAMDQADFFRVRCCSGYRVFRICFVFRV